MDDPKKYPASQEEQLERPTVEKQDCTPQMLFTPHAAFNDFLLRLEQLRSYHREWNDPRNQNRPFKQNFVDFIRQLVLRLPVAPEITPLVNGTVRFRYKKTHAPRDKWQSMEIIIYPQRHFEMTAKSRLPKQEPFKRSNMARPDYLSDMIQAFFELDHVNTKEHPLRYRKATVNDYPFIAAMAQSTFGPHAIYHVRNISQLLSYCVVAEDPMYGIVSIAALKEGNGDDCDYEVSFMITAQNYRGLSLASKCLRKALTNLLNDHPQARVLAKSIMRDNSIKDVCQSSLRRAGFKRTKVVRGEKRYRCFDCDRCNTLNGYCDFQNPSSVCSTAYYLLGDYGGKMGYGAHKQTI
jgi:hypothetical protein